MSRGKSKVGVVILAVIVLCVVVFGGLNLTRNFGKTESEITAEKSERTLDDLYNKVSPTTASPVKSSVDVSDNTSDADELPDISTHEYVVSPTTSTYAEIWSSGEKAGDINSTDGYLTAMATKFNNANITVDGKSVSIGLRSVTSGQSVDYMTSGKAFPTAYTPSNSLFIEMLNSKGVATTTVTDKVVGNVAGVVLKNDAYNTLVSKYGSADLNAITQSVANGELQFGYSNPFISATGMNFLISTLERYDSSNPLSDTAVEGFRNFQQNVPLVSVTTQQMRNAADRNSLDGFVTELQVYNNDATLKASYQFVPFGYRHDNPLVTINNHADETQQKIVKAFADYCEQYGSELASQDGFNGMDDYVCELPDVDGNTLITAQQLYKQNKNGNTPVVAVFVADVSGSMSGAPLSALKQSLINGIQYINSSSYIGLISYSDNVTINVPIAQFDMTQKTLFKGGVESLQANGGTATFNAIAVAGKMISDTLKDHPDAKPMIFVLSDGETNAGYSLDDIKSAIQGLNIPIYTIGYNADIQALQEISNISEAASINADTDDVTYQLKTLFNANL